MPAESAPLTSLVHLLGEDGVRVNSFWTFALGLNLFKETTSLWGVWTCSVSLNLL
ncbi:Hypothetical protein FKW44_013425 [Caligus rogercresseyi]|uniref:Uncharacterized protein n=1 Tax=Caligus rogercresseyi TaxID=217165 RepID=A0A7T8HL56_CALRO|nr:Hypothetical protein FKW44_013425 [Caligus rogercresseyi]